MNRARARYYVGYKLGIKTVFSSATVPTEETHGKLYAAVIGPFRTRRAAKLMAIPGSRYETVAAAERAAKRAL